MVVLMMVKYVDKNIMHSNFLNYMFALWVYFWKNVSIYIIQIMFVNLHKIRPDLGTIVYIVHFKSSNFDNNFWKTQECLKRQTFYNNCFLAENNVLSSKC